MFSKNQSYLNHYKILKKKDDHNVFTFNFGVGEEETIKDFNTVIDSQSSTFAEIANDSKYFLIKKKVLQPFSRKEYSYKQSVKIRKLSNFIEEKKLEKIHVLKIDTEGYEFNVLKGIKEGDFKKIKFILLEHHYDDMIKKNYKFSDINRLLTQNDFEKVFKIKMPFRKSFDYIYKNKKF